MGSDNATVARRYLTEIWGQGNLNAIDELVDRKIVLRDPLTPGEVTGRDQVRWRVEMMAKDWTDRSITIDEVIVAGDRVIVRDTWRGRLVGDFFGISNPGKSISCDAVEVLRIREGKVVENLSYFDVYTMFQQLGALPPPDKLRATSKASVQARADRLS